MKRVLCLHIPYLPIERLNETGERLNEAGNRSNETGVSKPGKKVRRVVVVAPSAGALRVVLADPSAEHGGARAGQSLAEASALVPRLAVHHHDAEADRCAIEKLACWAECLSPVVQIDQEHSLLADVTGCERLFGGEKCLVSRAVEGLASLGFTATGAIADTPGAAWALAHADGRERMVSAPGRVVPDVAHLPVWSLRIDAAAVSMLRAVGVVTIEALLHLPRASLAARFGEELLLRLDRVLGTVPEILTPFRPVPTVRAQVRFTGPTDRLELLRQAVDRALAVFCDQLAREVVGTRQIHVTFYYPRSGHQTIVLRISRATRNHAHLRSLLFVQLDDLKLPQKVEAVMVWTRQTQKLDSRQEEWFDTGVEDEAELADLADRLAARLGSGAVVRAVMADEHQPELAYKYESLADRSLDQRHGRLAPLAKSVYTKAYPSRARKEAIWFRGQETLPYGRGSVSGAAFQTPSKQGTACALVRPLRLLRKPVPISVIAAVLQGPPAWFRIDGTGCKTSDCRVAACVGPERVETGWWRGRTIRRDYYRTEDDTGCRYWLFREIESKRWFLHGFFD